MNITFSNFADRNSQSLTYDPKKATIPLKSSTGELVEAFTIKPNTKRYSLKSDQYEAEVVDRVNQLRASLGLGKHRVASNISMMARIKADDMAVNNYFDHTSPIFGSFGAYIGFCEMPSSAAGENIATGQSTPESVYNWFKSSGHYANMIGNYAHIGVGYNEKKCAGYNGAWVQEFATYKGSAQILITDMKGKPKVNTAITLGDPKDFAANQTFTTDASGKFTAKSVLFDSWEVYVGLTLYTDVKIIIIVGALLTVLYSTQHYVFGVYSQKLFQFQNYYKYQQQLTKNIIIHVFQPIFKYILNSKRKIRNSCRPGILSYKRNKHYQILLSLHYLPVVLQTEMIINISLNSTFSSNFHQHQFSNGV
ncbi:SCP-like_extracellular protein [Hexamita inflata]|uniref:SCP-like_extracellular protein n=1 Tax=Hexamita inflata TaxID=28002 RepID=A0ABP1GXI5_9EUKA